MGVRPRSVEEANELLMPVALHAAAYDPAVEHVEGGKQRGGAVALVVVGHRPASYAGDWVTRLIRRVMSRQFYDLHAILEFDALDDFRQLVLAL